MPRRFLPTLEVNSEVLEELESIRKEIGIKNLSGIRRLALGNFIDQFLRNERFRKEVKIWFQKITA